MLKKHLISVFNKFLEHENVQETLTKTIRRNVVNVDAIENLKNPYYDYTPVEKNTCDRDDIIFITSRFRSGSTVFWNFFRQMENVTAYYEPFNERQWFDSNMRGSGVDGTHKGVETYWDEYEGLCELKQYFEEYWIRKDLLLSEDSWHPKMKQYIEKLIESAEGRPVLQFNRIDFRLPWLRKNFPNAKIIHLYRNPRDQWCSFLTDKQLMNKDDVLTTYCDSFYLDSWCEDLKKFYPFLCLKQTPHPYQRFYYLWKLSYLHGLAHANLSISYENMAENPQNNLAKMAKLLDLPASQFTKACNVINPSEKNKWQGYADFQWFEPLEKECELVLSTFLKIAKLNHGTNNDTK
ncbi:sulfotransferase domain-containing protein [Thalassotalea eurytherma]|uniref:Sulfotransferase domain-containing protein n=1 Tax=Thalassotalea eurytherma TaxID=1144278 RepID=A0ABQ6H5S0_9GAMM|nr:sulfotransferase domain-containing protein [Thalassotalea eurytherma]GLX82105.1 hypothetical protein theurythT_15570 [Thalassotalea eurytherma]